MKILKITALLLLAVLLTGCGKEQSPAETTVPTVVTVPTETEPDVPGILEQAKQDGIAVETPYITFYYPNSWTELQSAAVTTEGKNSRVSFNATVGTQTVELFSMIIGPDEAEGYLLGMLDGMNVYSVMNEQNPEEWSEADYMDLCRQQEYVNELILQLHENPGFTAA